MSCFGSSSKKKKKNHRATVRPEYQAVDDEQQQNETVDSIATTDDQKEDDEGVPITRTTATRRALLIGIQYNKKIGQLYGTFNDVRSIADELHTQWGYSKITLMTDEDSNKKTELWPTRKNIQAQIAKLMKASRSGDRVYVHFSCHGNQDLDAKKKVSKKNESDGINEVIIDRDDKEILDDDLHKWLVSGLPKGVGAVYVMDCCDSGTNLDLQFTWLPKRAPNQIDRENDQGVKGKNIIQFSACRDPELSYEDEDSKGNVFGAFTLRWLQFLRQQKRNPPSVNPTWQEIIKEIFDDLKVAEPPIPQTPVLCSTDPDLMSQVFSL